MSKTKVEKGSGNVFADIGLPQPEEALAKARLAEKIGDILRRKDVTQKQAAALLGIDQPKVSALLRGRLDGFSAERLMKLLNLLGRDVEIVVKRHSRKYEDGSPRAGRIKVNYA